MKCSITKDKRPVQYLSATLATIPTACTSMYMAWSSPTLPKLMSDDSPIGRKITQAEASWIVSSFVMGSIPGCLLAAWLIGKIGSKKSILFSAFPLGAPWFVIMFTKSVVVLCVSRFVGGIGLGLSISASPIYISEISEKDIRGRLTTALNILRIVGSLYVFSVGPFVSYTVLNVTCCMVPIIFFITFIFMPESPYYLIRINNKDGARKNLKRLSKNSDPTKVIEDRLQEIEKIVMHDLQNPSTPKELFTNRENHKPLFIIAGVKALQSFSGFLAVEAYMQTIVQLSGSSISPEVSSVVGGVIQIIAATLSAAIIDKLGRKTLLIVSALGCAVALAGEGAYFYLQNVVGTNIENLSWLPTGGLLLFLLMNPIGIFGVPYVLLGELFATNIKGIAVSTSTFYGAILSFTSVKIFQPITDTWGIHVGFWFYGCVCVLGAIFAMIVLPETKGKSFDEIQNQLNPKRNESKI